MLRRRMLSPSNQGKSKSNKNKKSRMKKKIKMTYSLQIKRRRKRPALKKKTRTLSPSTVRLTVNCGDIVGLSQKLIRKFKRRENFGEDVAILQKSFHSEE